LAKKSLAHQAKPKKTFSDRLAIILLVGLVLFGSLTPVFRALSNVPYIGAYFYETGTVIPNLRSPHFLIEEVDCLGYYSYLRSLAIDHDLNFENDFTLFGWPAKAKEKTAMGLTANPWSIGPAILWSPAFLAGHLYSLALNATGNPVPTDGVSFVYDFFIVLASMGYGLIGLIFIYLFLRFFFPPLQSFLALIFYFYASPLVFYQFHEPIMSHTLTVFAASGFIYFWYRNWLKKGPKEWFWLGIWAGLMALIRSQDIFIFIVPAAAETFVLFRQNKKLDLSLIAGPLLMLAVSFICFIPQMLAWKILYGSYLTVPAGPGYMHWTSPALLPMLFSTNHGLITWTPIIIFCLAGLFLYKREKIEQRLLFWVFGLILLLEYYVNSAAGDFNGGWAFGARRFLSCSLIFAWGLGNLFDKVWANKKLLYTVSGLFSVLVIFNLLFYVQWAYGLIDKGAAITWQQYFAGKAEAFFLWLKVLRYLFSLAFNQ
jgi:hypothetical protein